MTLLTATQAEITRFMSHVDILPNGCWFWMGARSVGRGNKKPYGTFAWRKQRHRAHRFACEQIKGVALPEDHHRDHLCRFSLCVNPDHIDIVHKDINQARRHSPAPAITVHYEYVGTQLCLSLKIITPSVDSDFTPAQLGLYSGQIEPEKTDDKADGHEHFPPEL